MPRLLSRTLVILGAAVAATAAAWLISAASASADTMPDPVGSALANTANGAVPDLAGAISRPVSKTPPALDLPTPADTGWNRVTGQLGSTVDQLDRHMPIGHGIPLGGLPTLPVVGSTAPAQPDTGTVGVARPAVTSSTATAAVQALGHAVAGTTAEHGTAAGWRAIIAWPPTLPGLPGPQPLAPVTVPAAPGTTSGSGGSAGSGGLGLLDQSGLPATPGLDLVRVLRPTSALRRVTAGKQPGTTPD